MHPLTLGTAQLGLDYGVANRRGLPDERSAEAILEAALDMGVRSFDTAPAYGQSERRLGAFFRRKGWPAGAVVASKLPSLTERGLQRHEVPEAVATAVDASRRCLATDRLDVYLVHDARDLRSFGPALIEALAREIHRGTVGRAGLSAYDPEDAALATRHPSLTAVQFPLNVFDRRMLTTGVLSRVVSAGLTTFARSAYLQGLLSLAPRELPPALEGARKPLADLHALASANGLTALDLALAFVARQPGIDSVVVGAESPAQVRDTVGRLRRASALPEELIRRVSTAVPPLEGALIDPRRWPRREGGS